MVLLLYRHIAVELDELEETELPVEAIWIDRNSEVQEHEVIDHVDILPFVKETDGRGQYFIPEYRIDAALDHLSQIG